MRLSSIGVVTSSNDEAKSRALAKPEHGLMLVAEAQTGGRGSNNRHWISEKGNLFASLLLCPELPHVQAQNFVKMAGLAVMDVLKQNGLKPRLKAPNDVLVDGKKICGILVETVTKGDVPPSVIIGIGLNVASHPEIPEYPTTSIAALYSPLAGESTNNVSRWGVDALSNIPPRNLASQVPAPLQVRSIVAFLAESLHMRYESWRLNGFTSMEKEYHAACD